MKFKASAAFFAAILFCSVTAAVLPSFDTSLSLPEDQPHFVRRAEYNRDRIEGLEVKAGKADATAIQRSIEYLADIWSSHQITWALTGGIAMQKYGMVSRTTQDVDIAISALPRELHLVVLNDPKYTTPSTHATGALLTRPFPALNGLISE